MYNHLDPVQRTAYRIRFIEEINYLREIRELAFYHLKDGSHKEELRKAIQNYPDFDANMRKTAAEVEQEIRDHKENLKCDEYENTFEWPMNILYQSLREIHNVAIHNLNQPASFEIEQKAIDLLDFMVANCQKKE